MICPDCKGSKEYRGANIIEPCRLCKGTGEVDVPDHLPDDFDTIDQSRTPDHMLAPNSPCVGQKVFVGRGFDIECEVTDVDDSRQEFSFESTNGKGYAKYHEAEWDTNNGRWQIV